MGNLSSASNSIATMVSYDEVKRFRRQTNDRQLVLIGRFSTACAEHRDPVAGRELDHPWFPACTHRGSDADEHPPAKPQGCRAPLTISGLPCSAEAPRPTRRRPLLWRAVMKAGVVSNALPLEKLPLRYAGFSLTTRSLPKWRGGAFHQWIKTRKQS